MPFEKGKSGNPKGKKAGQQNKATLEFKEAVNKLIDYATPQMVEWLELVAQEDPSKALDHIYKFAQFGYPLLARTEQTGPDGGAQEHKITVELMGASKRKDS